ncbi:MAG: helix-turn-helix transcriptional regulator [Bacteroidota bacterium]
MKKISFKHRKSDSYNFDFVALQKVLNSQPRDHSQFDYHQLNFFVLFIIEKGEGVHSINYKDYPFRKGTIFTIRKEGIHKFHSSGAKGSLLVFTEEFALRFAGQRDALRFFQLFNEVLNAPFIHLEKAEFFEIKRLLDFIHKEYINADTIYSEDIIRNLLQTLIHMLFRIKFKGNDNVRVDSSYHQKLWRLQTLIEEHCFESRKVSFYAQKLGLTSRTLNNIVQHTLSKNVKQLIDDLYILRVKRLILNTDHTLTEIAFHSGFEDPSNFFKYFRKSTGYSPSTFRKNNRQ